MTKTIHIHLPPGMVVTRTTRDSGDWKESDHPRAKNGQFGSGGGGAKAPAAKEKGRQTSGTEGKQSLGKAELMKHPAANKADYDYLHRENGMSHEEIKSRWDREHAKKNPPPAPAAKKSTAPSSGAKTTGPHGIEATNLQAAAGGEKLQIRITKPEQAAWAKQHLGLKFSGEGMGAHNLTPEQAAKFKGAAKAPATGFAEREKEGAEKMPKGTSVQFGSGKPAGEVIRHAGNMVLTTQGEYHVSKLMPATKPNSTKPTASSSPPASAQKVNWSASNGDWSKAKAEGRKVVQEALSAAKSGGDKTDAMLALKKQAEVEHKKGSYLAAVVVGEVNDYFSRLK